MEFLELVLICVCDYLDNFRLSKWSRIDWNSDNKRLGMVVVIIVEEALFFLLGHRSPVRFVPHFCEVCEDVG